MTYANFEREVIDTFNRMHYAESCDDGFMIEGSECDAQHILSSAYCSELGIKYASHTGYTVSRDMLVRLYEGDDDDFYPEMFDSFNDIMNRYNVVPHDVEKMHIKGLQII